MPATRAPDPAFRDAVTAALPDLAGQDWQVLEGGRTNRLWRVGDTVVKRHDAAAGSPLFPNDPAAEVAALTRFGPEGLSPRLRLAGDGWLAYAHLPGAPWREGPAPVARLLYRLHGRTAPGFRALGSGSSALIGQAEAILAQCRGRLPMPDTGGDVPPVKDPVPLHGDPVPGNIVDGPGGPVLIDWQCPALGDPADDLAIFLSPAMQHLYRGTPLTEAERHAFLAAYPDRAAVDRLHRLWPLFRWRMAAHCLWKAERGDAAYAAALRLELAG